MANNKIKVLTGMHDIFPEESNAWQQFEQIVTQWATEYAYKQIRTPILEQTSLFVRSIGEETDVVGKEMYTFDDAGQMVSMRPEGTASCLRAVVEHNYLYNGPQKLWYMGPMFRRERPQKGRYRQFHQIGIEALGFAGPDIDVEIIAMCADLWQRMGIDKYVVLQINSLGNKEERLAYREALVAYLQQYKAILDEDSLRRMDTNPLRVLDTKNPDLQEMCNNAPKLIDYLGEESLAHYDTLKTMLRALNISYEENPRLVRGLDYYNLTVFEWVTEELGSQGTVCGGGRYNGLIADLGGKDAPAIGFAMGIERLLLLAQSKGCLLAKEDLHIYIVHSAENSTVSALQYANLLRLNQYAVQVHFGGQKLQNQFKKADASGARFALILAANELANNTVTIKDLRGDKGQVTVAAGEMVKQLNEWMVD